MVVAAVEWSHGSSGSGTGRLFVAASWQMQQWQRLVLACMDSTEVQFDHRQKMAAQLLVVLVLVLLLQVVLLLVRLLLQLLIGHHFVVLNEAWVKRECCHPVPGSWSGKEAENKIKAN